MKSDPGQNRRAADALAAMTGQVASSHEVAPSTEVSSPPDEALAPPPAARTFAPRRSNLELSFQRSLQRRRTLIPVMLTLGVLLPALASLKWFMPLTPFGELSIAEVLLIGLAGACMLIVAMLNMLQVRHMLRSSLRPPPSSGV